MQPPRVPKQKNVNFGHGYELHKVTKGIQRSRYPSVGFILPFFLPSFLPLFLTSQSLSCITVGLFFTTKS
ncbi:hypothetical protein BDQ12DRAFT_691212 [Crucibulum laeve]|uniref:Uncharacterized protein n=1 Tax=Crucibulum laeve TaxID=68775 RepID=A0A5C3LJP4_9AGAR|nr:hypothetical protein BDQ12DRAFT_691212 [Crucibulum laeve]